MIPDSKFRHRAGALVAVLLSAMSISMAFGAPGASAHHHGNPYLEPRVTIDLGPGCKSAAGFTVHPVVTGGTATRMTALLGLRIISNRSAAPWDFVVPGNLLKNNRYYLLTVITRFSSGAYYTNFVTFKTCKSHSRHARHSRHKHHSLATPS